MGVMLRILVCSSPPSSGSSALPPSTVESLINEGLKEMPRADLLARPGWLLGTKKFELFISYEMLLSISGLVAYSEKSNTDGRLLWASDTETSLLKL